MLQSGHFWRQVAEIAGNCPDQGTSIRSVPVPDIGHVPVKKMSPNGQQCASVKWQAVRVGGLSARILALAAPFRAPCIHSTRGAAMEPTKSESRHVRDPELLMLVGRWRARAQEVLAQAETMRDAEARQMMQEIAARYERLAQQVEQQTGRTDKV